MAFKFSLQHVLEMREHHVKECEIALEKARGVVTRLRQMLTEERNLYFSERDALNALIRENKYAQIDIYDKGLELRKARMIELLQALRDAENDVAIAENALKQAKQQLKVIENFREKKLREFEREELRKENKLLGELAIMRYLRKEQAQEER